ncbi:MAG: glycosyltransferase family 4 protein [Alphaproteobacteria bacterium]|nr:glycosyltransferase family 4 protein [Alphaproteobacteria bacterium]MCW5739312.1 glycosyltransferase family 4 protein [Alphaproteobacteria bacterium]
MPETGAKKIRVAYLVTHPIQYQAPLLRMIAADRDLHLEAFFAADFSARAFHDPEFGRAVEWDVPLLDGYQSEVLPAWPGTRYPGDAYFDAWRPFSRGLRRRLREGRFDALWVHGYARLPHVAAMLAARSAGVRVLLRDEANGIGQAHPGARAAIKRALFGLIDRLVDRYLTIGTLNEAHYRDLGIDPAKFTPMGYAVDNAWFRARIAEAAANRETLRRSLDLAPGRPVALYAAKLIERKAPLDLVEAFAAATRDGEAVLLMAGDGELRARIEARIAQLDAAGRIRLLGFQPQRQLAALYELCDLFVLPSQHETWGLVVNEVMNAGRPVIASDRVGSARDLVRDGVNGFVYPFGDVAALTGRLRASLADRDRLAAMGRQSLNIIDGWGFEQNLAGLKSALARLFPDRGIAVPP